MWTRYELKYRAKDMLRKNYWYAFLVSLVLAFIDSNAVFGYISLKRVVNIDINLNPYQYGIFPSLEILQFIKFYWPFLLIGFLFSFVLSLIFMFLISFQFEVGGARFFIKAVYDEIDLENLTYTYNKSRFINVIITMLIRNLIIALISILGFILIIITLMLPIIQLISFILIPVISVYILAKSISLSMVPYILADNPNIHWKRAIKLSEDMTYGHKFNIFLLNLSFIGWQILGVLACGIGILFVYPYIHATFAELYIKLKQIAYEKNLCSSADFVSN